MNEKEFDFLGITRFHELGYKGQGIKVASHEEIIKGVFDDVFVKDPSGREAMARTLRLILLTKLLPYHLYTYTRRKSLC